MNTEKKTRQPWAIGITAVIVVFLVATITVTIMVSRQEYSLVTDNYYEKDLAYQQEIDTRMRTRDLAQKPVLVLDRAAKSCSITFPAREHYGELRGTVTFFRISSARGDYHVPLQLNSAGEQHISVSGLAAGQWILKLRWQEKDREYFMEERIYLQH
ncbi:MAG: FixH family protein [Bacteroidota bacterium]|nr:FixH family protein [Bacteroidota bacterium]